MDTLTNLAPWGALLSGLVLLVDDLIFAPRRRLAAPGSVAAQTPSAIRSLRWIFLLLLAGTVRWMFRSQAVDFSLLLVLATAVTGVLWALDRLVLRPLRNRAGQGGPAVRVPDTRVPGADPAAADAPFEPVSVEYARSFFPVIVLVLVIRSFVFEPFRIPSDSMMPTLRDGDFIFVNKFAYGLRLPVLNVKILDTGGPRRGDVVVFRKPSEPRTNYIKRLVGLPGDRIVVRDRRVYVNGVLQPMTVDGIYQNDDKYNGARLATEKLGDVEHQVMNIPWQISTEGEYNVPAGTYFFMGDNRDNSQDSRFEGVGYVPEGNLVGKAVRIWFNWDGPHGPIWSRIGNEIH
jgi:signal peptidase I